MFALRMETQHEFRVPFVEFMIRYVCRGVSVLHATSIMRREEDAKQQTCLRKLCCAQWQLNPALPTVSPSAGSRRVEVIPFNLKLEVFAICNAKNELIAHGRASGILYLSGNTTATTTICYRVFKP